MAALSKQAVEKVAHLARIDITDEEAMQYSAQLSNIMNLIDEMNQAETDELKPMAHPKDINQRLREDVQTEQNQRELFQQNAPDTELGLYLVPKVID